MRDVIEEAKRRHPARGGSALHKRDEAPLRRFMDALVDYTLNVSLYGASSLEAAQARANLEQHRELAVDAWRNAPTAA